MSFLAIASRRVATNSLRSQQRLMMMAKQQPKRNMASKPAIKHQKSSAHIEGTDGRVSLKPHAKAWLGTGGGPGVGGNVATWPVIICVGAGCVLAVGFGMRHLLFSPDVQIGKTGRSNELYHTEERGRSFKAHREFKRTMTAGGQKIMQEKLEGSKNQRTTLD